MREKLPPADWTRRAELAELVAALGPGNARYVGGAVRDTLLGCEVHDIDIATPLEPVEVIARLEAAGIRSVPTGIKHGTITAIREGDNVEITTLRRDLTTDGRHARVAFSQDWREDAARRDFTINALYADPHTLEVFDWFGGLDDLHVRRVRFIGDARQRIREDHLRILRYFRFQARFGSQPADEEAESACAELAPMLKGLSRERIGWELQNLLALPDPAPTVARMAELGVLGAILPEADAAGLSRLVAVETREAIAADPIRRLAALLPADPGIAEQVAARLRLSIAQKKRLILAARRGEEADPRGLAYRIGTEAALDRLMLAGRETTALNGWHAPAFPLKGGAIVARGVAAGPEVARILRAVEADWIAEGFPDADRVAELLDKRLMR
ncbi:CCA tRNA nucleotidyltransferase [Novosphingobium sp. Gsoil 351]|uniref:CCA tRNA nucleotidyltransferase n=1 Tax=Novosphingobium sp. Gsoil 351 TaxID=2675225 RepID=UPI0012B4FEBB|nr:CCA tRNA nucleotidyltransferase [Novosphingobium sp. Gsoil 351]QGN53536.1 CCA tRNA nucleotidyltransferase [Novosphingobium sp. Gsoil 351]